MAIEKFFGCCSLKTGVITLAILALILDTILLSFIIAILTNWEGYFQNYFKNYNVIENYFNYASVVLIADQVASILLLYGALRRKKNFILPWLIVNGTLVSCFVTITAIFVGFLCVLLICFGIMMYVWLCVGAFYKRLREEEEAGLGAVYTTVLFSKE